jgi:predicted ArsR family transcriptional regulator
MLVDGIAGKGGRKQLREIGVAFGRELGRASGVRPVKRLEPGFERLCEAVRSLGYQASVESVDRDRAVIASPTCPLRPLVRARPEAVEIDRGMWAGLASCALSGVDAQAVSCETRDCFDDHASCKIRLQLR